MVIKMTLSSLPAVALAAAIVAAAAVPAFSWLPDLLVWAAFVGWASYDHSGAGKQAALRSSAALAFGVVMAWLVAISVVTGALPLSTSLTTAICAGIASFLIVMALRMPYLSIVPVMFYGFASTLAYLSLSPNAFTVSAITTPSWSNAISCVPISLLIGTGLGMVHGLAGEGSCCRQRHARARVEPGRSGAVKHARAFVPETVGP